MSDDWTNDIRRLMKDYEVKAPDGLLDEVKKSLAQKKPAPAKTRPLWHYRWVAAAAVFAAIAVPTAWRLLTKDGAQGPATANVSSPTSNIVANNNGSNTPSTVIKQAIAKVFGTDEMAENGRSAYNNGELAYNGSSTAEQGDSTALFSMGVADNATDATTSQKQTAPTYKKSAKSRKRTYRDFDNYDLAYEPTTTRSSGGKVSIGAYYGGSVSSNSNTNTTMPMLFASASSGNIINMAMPEGKPMIASVPMNRKAHHSQPIKAGVSLGYKLNNRWSVQTGVTYSYLSSDFTYDDGRPKENQRLHYVGVPLTASYSIVKGRKAEVYVTGGGEVEKLVKGKISSENNEEEKVKEHRPQWSVKAAVGGAYHFTPSLSVYVEPGVSHHFDNHSDVENVYKDRPTSFSLNMGVRFNINKNK